MKVKTTISFSCVAIGVDEISENLSKDEINRLIEESRKRITAEAIEAELNGNICEESKVTNVNVDYEILE